MPSPPPVLIELSQANVQFAAVTALQALDIRIHAGERVALVGANGSGKSTLLRLLHGLIVPSSGQRSTAAGVRQAMLFQRPFVLRLSAQNNVALGLYLAGTPWRAARQQALAALASVGLVELAARNARTLSGGQQQRLALARAQALSPQILLLDEPTASLDPHAKREVEALIDDFARPSTATEATMTLIFSSHNLGQVKRLASRVIELDGGRVVHDLPVAEFFHPARKENGHEKI